MSKLSLEMQSYFRYSDKKRGFSLLFNNPIKIQFINIKKLKKKKKKKKERTGNKTILLAQEGRTHRDQKSTWHCA